MHTLALIVELLTVLLTFSGIAYSFIALLALHAFRRDSAHPAAPSSSTGVSILKPVKGVDPRMYAGFVSHCTQTYTGPVELLFGVSSLADPAVAEIARLRVEYPGADIRLIECTERLGTSGKVSNLVQMLAHAQYPHVLINDSDIVVPPDYLERILAPFADPAVGMVTAPYIGVAGPTVWSRLEALGISTDFMPGVLTARFLERGIRFGLGSTLAMSRTALEASGGLRPLTDHLADDYELGARIARAGFRVELAPVVVQTGIPAYNLRGFCDHQLRWARSTRDSRRWGYAGLGVTYVLPWALASVLASGAALWSFTLLSFALLIRVAVALSVGVGLLRDGQVLRDLLLLPLRDFCGLFFWLWSFASDTVVWRGEHFHLHRGRLTRLP